ncbi:cupin domain-containing protein [Granulicella sp. WH15]|uniref:cupin domain-containing protein n=1 Tax=Granulicella sp. WH15 TaxID=2602070 RepID=UPI0013678F8E|nr:cupin domain-containing protein [Granulicella sp. WH15]QHN02823.1 cupin domain-containing protein [Granulicella sp. WH15]
MSTASLHRWSDIPPEQLNPMLTRQYISGEQSMIARIVLDKGCVVPTHQHPNEQIAYIVSGALEFVIEDGTPGGVKHIVRAGEVLVIPANIPHSAVALEDTVDLDLFAPPRQDWLTNTDTYLR